VDAQRKQEGAQRVVLLVAGLGGEALEGLDAVGGRKDDWQEESD
jgi:hypothetical protein